MIPQDQYLIKQAFSHYNTMKKYQTKEESERYKGNVTTADMYELKKLKVQGRLELAMRALQTEIMKRYEDKEEEVNK